ncbi:DUF6587 family protein [Thermus scotoductus]|uniref:DUF6587 family protein n=1 Tax=Thermus scotoductus TaxID=37636 RepID=UPI003F50F0EF
MVAVVVYPLPSKATGEKYESQRRLSSQTSLRWLRWLAKTTTAGKNRVQDSACGGCGGCGGCLPPWISDSGGGDTKGLHKLL